MSQHPQDQQPPAPRYEAPPTDAPRYQAPPPDAPRYVAPPPPPVQPQPVQPQFAPPLGQPVAPPAQYQQPYYAPQPLPGPGGVFDGAAHPDDLHRPLYGASFGQAISRFFKQYVKFDGRASRSEYWWAALFVSLVYLGLVIVGAILASMVDALRYSYSSPAGTVAGFFAIVSVLWLLAVLLPGIAISWRRLHDANLAGPLYLLSLIPYVGWIPVLILTLLPPKPEGRRFDRPRV